MTGSVLTVCSVCSGACLVDAALIHQRPGPGLLCLLCFLMRPESDWDVDECHLSSVFLASKMLALTPEIGYMFIPRWLPMFLYQQFNYWPRQWLEVLYSGDGGAVPFANRWVVPFVLNPQVRPEALKAMWDGERFSDTF